MAGQKRGLGRGLDALLGQSNGRDGDELGYAVRVYRRNASNNSETSSSRECHVTYSSGVNTSLAAIWNPRLWKGNWPTRSLQGVNAAELRRGPGNCGAAHKRPCLLRFEIAHVSNAFHPSLEGERASSGTY